jgi:hypothetical protein
MGPSKSKFTVMLARSVIMRIRGICSPMGGAQR